MHSTCAQPASSTSLLLLCILLPLLLMVLLLIPLALVRHFFSVLYSGASLLLLLLMASFVTLGCMLSRRSSSSDCLGWHLSTRLLKDLIRFVDQLATMLDLF